MLGKILERVASYQPLYNTRLNIPRASVLVPLLSPQHPLVKTSELSPSTSSSCPHVLLTVRSSLLNSHAGEVSFPGGKLILFILLFQTKQFNWILIIYISNLGKREKDDTNDLEAALRETEEEIGIPRSKLNVYGALDQAISKNLTLVTPFVALVHDSFNEFVMNESEVAEIFTVPLDFFLKAEHHSNQDILWNQVPHRLHNFTYNKHVIWGLTAAILIQLAKQAFNQSPEFDDTYGVSPSDLAKNFDGQIRFPQKM